MIILVLIILTSNPLPPLAATMTSAIKLALYMAAAANNSANFATIFAQFPLIFVLFQL